MDVLPGLGSGLIKGWLATCRWHYVGLEHVERLMAEGRPFVGATWHFDLISVVYHFRDCDGVVMVSRSQDGEAVARLVRRWGYETVRGSKHKGGLDAAADMIRALKTGRYKLAGLIADGSQGPARRAQTGTVFVARASGAPIVPIVLAAKRKITFGTWDRMQIPLPFTQVALYCGQPFYVRSRKEGGVLDEARRQLETALNDLTDRAEAHPWA